MKKFKRTTEDFTCEHCGARVHGNGYTNHCPACLWCKHVDVHPGDRQSDCGGLMEPTGTTMEHGTTVLVHRCTRCHATKVNKIAPDDDVDLLIQLSTHPVRLPS